jgi:hypothetical protein
MESANIRLRKNLAPMNRPMLFLVYFVSLDTNEIFLGYFEIYLIFVNIEVRIKYKWYIIVITPFQLFSAIIILVFENSYFSYNVLCMGNEAILTSEGTLVVAEEYEKRVAWHCVR